MKKPESPPQIDAAFSYKAFLDSLSGQDFYDFLQVNDRVYPYFDQTRQYAKKWNVTSEDLWAALKTQRYGNKSIRFSKIAGFSFNFSTPSVIQEFLHEFDMNLGGSIQGDGIIPSEDKDRYLLSSIMEEAIASSQLEGAVTGRKVAKDMLVQNRKPRNESEQMIVNNYEAMNWVVANKNASFTVENIKALHKTVTNSTLQNVNDEGNLRESNDIHVADVQTGDVVYIPPTYDHLQELMKDFCRFANDQGEEKLFIHPIVKAIILHFLIGYIHPFADGNGRTARTIFYWYLLKKGYWLIEYMSVSRMILASKAQYARAYLYTEQDNNDLTYFIIYHLQTTRLALAELKKYISRKTVEKKNAITLLRFTALNDRQILMAQSVLSGNFVYFTVKQVQNKFGVSDQTARNDLNDLVSQGLFEQRRTGHSIQFFPVPDFSKKLIPQSND
jgi:Fic family protein